MHKILALIAAFTMVAIAAILFFFTPLADADGLAGRRARAINDARIELQIDEPAVANRQN